MENVRESDRLIPPPNANQNSYCSMRFLAKSVSWTMGLISGGAGIALALWGPRDSVRNGSDVSYTWLIVDSALILGGTLGIAAALTVDKISDSDKAAMSTAYPAGSVEQELSGNSVSVLRANSRLNGQTSSDESVTLSDDTVTSSYDSLTGGSTSTASPTNMSRVGKSVTSVKRNNLFVRTSSLYETNPADVIEEDDAFTEEEDLASGNNDLNSLDGNTAASIGKIGDVIGDVIGDFKEKENVVLDSGLSGFRVKRKEDGELTALQLQQEEENKARRNKRRLIATQSGSGSETPTEGVKLQAGRGSRKSVVVSDPRPDPRPNPRLNNDKQFRPDPDQASGKSGPNQSPVLPNTKTKHMLRFDEDKVEGTEGSDDETFLYAAKSS